MRNRKYVAIAVLSIALVFGSLVPALGGVHASAAPFKATKPRVSAAKVVMGVSFDATGFVTPAIAADDASTTVAVRAYNVSAHGRRKFVGSFSATLAALDDTHTAYDAVVALPKAGAYVLVAVVWRDGSPVARSAARPVLVVLPYKVTKPRLLSPKVAEGVSFEATGVVAPSIAADDASTTVSVVVYRLGKRNVAKRIDVVDAVLTGDAGSGTGYSAELTLAKAGKYVLVSVVRRDGVVLGRSTKRPVKVVKDASAASSRAKVKKHSR